MIWGLCALLLLAVWVPVAVAALATPATRVVTMATHVSTTIDCTDSDEYLLLSAHWQETDLPIEVWLDKEEIPLFMHAEVEDGIAPWGVEEHPEGTLAKLITDRDAADIEVTYDYVDGKRGGALAVTLLYVDGGNHVINGTIIFDELEEWKTLMATECTHSISEGVSVIDVATHEFGHAFILLDHPDTGDWLTMHGGYHRAMRTLATGDKLGVENRHWHTHYEPPLCNPVCPTSASDSELVLSVSASPVVPQTPRLPPTDSVAVRNGPLGVAPVAIAVTKGLKSR